MENLELKNKLSKIYELVKRGGTEGEKIAAKKALDKLLEKHNLQGIDLDSLDKSIYNFKYKTQLDEWLLFRIVAMFAEDAGNLQATKHTYLKKEITLNLTYLDFIAVHASYEYFKRHMASQWKKVCALEVKRKRTSKSKNICRQQLQEPFFSRYVIKSGLYKEHEIENVDLSSLSKKQLDARHKMLEVEGGKYNKQVTNGILLEN